MNYIKILRFFLPLAVIVLLFSCTTTQDTFVPTRNTIVDANSNETNFVVFPTPNDRTQTPMLYGSNPQEIFTQWGDPVDPMIELIFYNATQHYQAGQQREAVERYVLAVLYAADIGQVLSREQLWNILTHRAYCLIELEDSSDALKIWDFQISMWHEGDDWKRALPDGLVISTTESSNVAGYNLGLSYGERSIALTVIGDFQGAFYDITEAAGILDQYGYPEKAIWYSLAFMSNSYNLTQYEWAIEANPLISELITNNPTAYTPEQLLQLGRLTAMCEINLGDAISGYRKLLNNIGLAESIGYSDQMTGFDKKVVEEFKKELSDKVSTENYNIQDALLAEDTNAVRILLENDMDPNKFVDNMTPLMTLSRYSGNVEIAKILLEAGADPNVQGDINVTALSLGAGYTDNLAIVQLLLDYGADPNISSPQGWTSLMLAARRGSSPDIVEALLAAGADPSAQTKGGATALLIAETGVNRSNKIIRILRNAKD